MKIILFSPSGFMSTEPIHKNNVEKNSTLGWAGLHVIHTATHNRYLCSIVSTSVQYTTCWNRGTYFSCLVKIIFREFHFPFQSWRIIQLIVGRLHLSSSFVVKLVRKGGLGGDFSWNIMMIRFDKFFFLPYCWLFSSWKQVLWCFIEQNNITYL